MADRLGVSTNFVVEEIQDGRLAAMVIKRDGVRTLYRISESGLEAYLQRYRWTSTGLAERAGRADEPKP